MADQPTTPSGSRWEPDGTESPTIDSPALDAPADVPPTAGKEPAPAAGAPVTADGDPAAPSRRAQLRSRAVLAGAATALTLGGGLAGFVIGHSTADGDNAGFRPANFSNQGPGGRLGQQGPPSFGDGDGDRPGPPQGPADDSSSEGSTDDSTGDSAAS
jgi:hypothetical protein